MNSHLVVKVEEGESMGIPYLTVTTDQARYVIRSDRYTHKSYMVWRSLIPMKDTLIDVQPADGVDFYSSVIATFGGRSYKPDGSESNTSDYITNAGISTMQEILRLHSNVFECKDFYAFVKRVVDAEPTTPVGNVYQFWGEYWMEVGLFEKK